MPASAKRLAATAPVGPPPMMRTSGSGPVSVPGMTAIVHGESVVRPVGRPVLLNAFETSRTAAAASPDTDRFQLGRRCPCPIFVRRRAGRAGMENPAYVQRAVDKDLPGP